MSENASQLAKIFHDYHPGPTAAPNGLDVYRIKKPWLKGRRTGQDGSFLIAITALGNCVSLLKERHHIEEGPYLLDQLTSNGWQRLGYDVADHWLCSGLMNCGDRPEEKASLLSKFGRGLNRYGLFDPLEAAEEFRVESKRLCSANIRIACFAPGFSPMIQAFDCAAATEYS